MRVAVLLLAPLALAACVSAPAVEELMLPRERSAAALQLRHYQGVRAEDVPPAVVTVLQDLGFHVTASEPALGLIVATRGYQKSVEEFGREFGRDVLQVLKNAVTLQWHREPSAERTVGAPGFSAAVSITPAASGSAVRLSLHRYVSKPTGEAIVIWAEEMTAPESYSNFFALLSQALAKP